MFKKSSGSLKGEVLCHALSASVKPAVRKCAKSKISMSARPPRHFRSNRSSKRIGTSNQTNNLGRLSLPSDSKKKGYFCKQKQQVPAERNLVDINIRHAGIKPFAVTLHIAGGRRGAARPTPPNTVRKNGLPVIATFWRLPARSCGQVQQPSHNHHTIG
jgi:hypothetical protein